MTQAELLTECRRQLSQTDPDNSRWTDTILADWLDAGQELVVLLTGCLMDIRTQNSGVDQEEYTAPDDMIKLLWMEYNDKPIYPKKREVIAREYQDWRSEASSTPRFYYWTTLLPTGKKFGLYPKPSEIKVIKYGIIKRPVPITVLVNAEIQVEYHRTLPFYCVWRALLEMGKREDAKIAYQEFLNMVELVGKGTTFRDSDVLSFRPANPDFGLNRG